MVRLVGKYDIVEKNQCGFSKGKSCPMEFFGFLGLVYRRMDKHDLDFPKAFDTQTWE